MSYVLIEAIGDGVLMDCRTFVEEPKISVEDLKNRFLKGSTYMTKTQG